MYKIIGFLFLSFLISSCNSKKKEMERTIDQWLGKELILAGQYKSFSIDRDSVKVEKLPQNTLQIVSYINALGCSTCLDQLAEWARFKHENTDYDISLTLVIAIADSKHLLYHNKKLLKAWDIDFVVYFDEKNLFNGNNKLPKNKLLNTFLVDSNNKILLVGTPLAHQKVADLYRQSLKTANLDVN